MPDTHADTTIKSSAQALTKSKGYSDATDQMLQQEEVSPSPIERGPDSPTTLVDQGLTTDAEHGDDGMHGSLEHAYGRSLLTEPEVQSKSLRHRVWTALHFSALQKKVVRKEKGSIEPIVQPCLSSSPGQGFLAG